MTRVAPYRLVKRGGGLFPASRFDEESLASYPDGSVLQMSAWQGRSAGLTRKYWAILQKVVKDCPTPWESAEEANDALKLALGVTETSKTVSGKWFVRPASISFAAMDESRFREFFDGAMAILSKMTGIDVIDLGREAPDTGPDELPSQKPAEAQDAPQATDIAEVQETAPTATGDGLAWLQAITLCLMGGTHPDARDVFAAQWTICKTEWPDIETRQDEWFAKLQKVFGWAKSIVMEEKPGNVAAQLIANETGLTVAEIQKARGQ